MFQVYTLAAQNNRNGNFQGGGATYVKNGIHMRKRNDLAKFEEGHFESCFVEVIDPWR